MSDRPRRRAYRALRYPNAGIGDVLLIDRPHIICRAFIEVAATHLCERATGAPGRRFAPCACINGTEAVTAMGEAGRLLA